MKEDSDKIRALIVDDDEPSRLLLRSLLSEVCDCTLAVDGKEAIEAVQKSIEAKSLYDLVCLDILMPEVDGLDALKRIRQIEGGHNIPEALRCKVLMTTTVSQLSKTMKAFHYGCSAYLVKPIDKNDLIREMKKLSFGTSFNAKWRGI